MHHKDPSGEEHTHIATGQLHSVSSEFWFTRACFSLNVRQHRGRAMQRVVGIHLGWCALIKALNGRSVKVEKKALILGAKTLQRNSSCLGPPFCDSWRGRNLFVDSAGLLGGRGGDYTLMSRSYGVRARYTPDVPPPAQVSLEPGRVHRREVFALLCMYPATHLQLAGTRSRTLLVHGFGDVRSTGGTRLRKQSHSPDIPHPK